MFNPLNGPSKPGKMVAVGIATPVEVKKGAEALTERKVVTLQSHSVDDDYGSFYVYLSDDGETPNAATVADHGFVQTANSLHSYEASETQAIWVLSLTGTIDIRFVERA